MSKVIEISSGKLEVLSDEPPTNNKQSKAVVKAAFLRAFLEKGVRWKRIKNIKEYNVSGVSRFENLTSHRVLI